MGKQTLVLDFDGVLHSYTSGWKGAAVISDPPVDGALKFIVTSMDHFRIAIFSSRSHQWGGRGAMKKWLHRHLVDLGINGQYPADAVPEWWKERIFRSAGMDPWEEEVEWAASLVINDIEWPWFKPPALVSIDDRAIQFTGTFPSLEEILAFKPWNKRG